MSRPIEDTLVSLDGVFDSPQDWGLANFQDDAYRHDGLGFLLGCHAMLMGRRTYEIVAKIYSSRTDPWAVRLNAMQKYVFTSTLEKPTGKTRSLSEAGSWRGDQAQAAGRARPSHLGPR